MTTPIRNVADAAPGQITATPSRVLRKLGIRRLPIHGFRAGRRRK